MTYLVIAAIAGAVLLYVPGKILEQYNAVSQSGPVAQTLFVVAVSVGAILFFGAFATVFYRLYRNSKLKKQRQDDRNKAPSELTSTQKQSEFEDNLELVRKMGDEAGDQNLKFRIEPLVRDLEEKDRERKLEIVAFGSISSGKSSVLNLLAGRNAFKTDAKGGTTVERNSIPWPGQDQVFLVDTPGLGEIDGEEHVNVAAEAARDADIVLLVVDGPIRDHEFNLLENLASMEKRVLICINKSDWFKPEDREKLRKQILEQTRKYVQPEDVVFVQAKPVERVRQIVDSQGNATEETVTVEPDIEQLAERMLNVIQRDGRDLLLANLLLQSRGIVENAKKDLEKALYLAAIHIVDRYMWTVGGVTAANPFPILDLAAGCAINTKMVMDLAKVYQQNIDLETVTNLIGQMGKTLITTISTNTTGPIIAAAVGSMLKTVPGIGTVAGGAVQGLAQAIVTRWIGLVFVDYFRNEMQQPEGGITALAREKWNMITSVNELRKIVKQARESNHLDSNNHSS